MTEGHLASETRTRTLSRSMEQMCVNTPVGKKASNQHQDILPTPLSPPQTVDAKQKRERSESMLLSQTNDMLATKRRLRSRSRLGLGPEDIPSAFMSPPCSTKPRERTHSRSHILNELTSFPEEFKKRAAFDIEVCSVYMTPMSEPREPLQNKDMNKIEPVSEKVSSFEESRLTSYPSDSSSDEESFLEDKTRLKLNFDQYAAEGYLKGKLPANHVAIPDPLNVIGRRMGEKKIDFIKELVNMNCEEICKQIFCNLEPCDLQRVASVSKLWRKICKKDRIASPRLDQFISGRKQHVMQKGKENLGHHTTFDYSAPQRHPFSVKDGNTIWTPSQTKSTTAIKAVKTNIMSTYERMKCPLCGSPSKKTANDTCECSECQEIFCSICQHKVDNNHKTGKCTIKVRQSKKYKEMIGSKKSKDRLKRY